MVRGSQALKTNRTIATIIAVWLVLTLFTGAVSLAFSVSSWHTLRNTHVVMQNKWWTCGAAAVATLLSFYYDQPLPESELVAEALLSIGQVEIAQDGFSMATLQQLLGKRGVQSKGYRLTAESLIDYFQRGGSPVILHVTRPRAHFVVALGLVGQMLAVADPSFGERMMDMDTLRQSKGFQGYVLVPTPTKGQAIIVAVNQAAALNRFERMYTQLVTIGGVLHRLP